MQKRAKTRVLGGQLTFDVCTIRVYSLASFIDSQIELSIAKLAYILSHDLMDYIVLDFNGHSNLLIYYLLA